jgi:hypothetical protein
MVNKWARLPYGPYIVIKLGLHVVGKPKGDSFSFLFFFEKEENKVAFILIRKKEIKQKADMAGSQDGLRNGGHCQSSKSVYFPHRIYNTN